MIEKPKYIHEFCKKCIFLRQVVVGEHDVDLYFCPEGEKPLVARYSNLRSEGSYINSNRAEFIVAEYIARERGLLKTPKPITQGLGRVVRVGKAASSTGVSLHKPRQEETAEEKVVKKIKAKLVGGKLSDLELM